LVNDHIRTNTNLWICLRVVSDAESMEILGSRDAAQPDACPIDAHCFPPKNGGSVLLYCRFASAWFSGRFKIAAGFRF